MKSFAFTVPFLIVAMSLSFKAPGAHAGLPCFNCPNIPPLSCPNGLLLVECDVDCKATHYSAGGACDSNFNCICSGSPPANPDKCEAAILNGQRVPACQCLSNLLTVGAAFQAACNFDCQCNHGAEFGTCLFDKHQCSCGSSAGFVWTSATCTIPGGGFNVDEAIQPLIALLNG